MRAFVQRVSRAEVREVLPGGSRTVSSIGRGLLVLLGVAPQDGEAEVAYLCDKLQHMRIFADDAGRMNLSVHQVGGAVLLVSQFTLFGDLSGGRRPGFSGAARPEVAEPLYQALAQSLRQQGLEVGTGVFGAAMEVELVNDGPVSLWIDTDQRPRRPGDRPAGC